MNKKIYLEITEGLRTLLMPRMKQSFEELAIQARKESLSYEEYLYQLILRELDSRHHNRVERYLKESLLPLEKSLDNFDLQRLPGNLRHQLKSLLEGGFIERKENILAFGKPGSGKTHLLCALAQQMIRQGYKALYKSCTLLIQELLIAKRELRLSRLIKKLISYDLLVIDEIGYIQQSREEMEVLFTLFTECYEKISVLISSNLPFSKWEGIFKDNMMAVAVVDRLVHHSVVIELNLESYRLEKSRQEKSKSEKQADKEIGTKEANSKKE